MFEDESEISRSRENFEESPPSSKTKPKYEASNSTSKKPTSVAPVKIQLNLSAAVSQIKKKGNECHSARPHHQSRSSKNNNGSCYDPHSSLEKTPVSSGYKNAYVSIQATNNSIANMLASHSNFSSVLKEKTKGNSAVKPPSQPPLSAVKAAIAAATSAGKTTKGRLMKTQSRDYGKKCTELKSSNNCNASIVVKNSNNPPATDRKHKTEKKGKPETVVSIDDMLQFLRGAIIHQNHMNTTSNMKPSSKENQVPKVPQSAAHRKTKTQISPMKHRLNEKRDESPAPDQKLVGSIRKIKAGGGGYRPISKSPQRSTALRWNTSNSKEVPYLSTMPSMFSPKKTKGYVQDWSVKRKQKSYAMSSSRTDLGVNQGGWNTYYREISPNSTYNQGPFQTQTEYSRLIPMKY